MILYVNGESFSAGAKAVNDFSFANDDFRYVALGNKPHPDNLKVSYGMHLSKMLALALVCNAESNATNEQILLTTYEYLESISPKQKTLIVIGWSAINKKTLEDHNNIYQLHQYLSNNSVPHLFFNATDPFTLVPQKLHKNWGVNFVHPYIKSANGHTHLNWAQYLFNWLTANNISV